MFFCPHSMIFQYTKRGEKPQRVNLLDEKQISFVKELTNSGYKQSSTPMSHTSQKIWNENDLRAIDLKWDTVIHKKVRMKSGSLFNPTLTLHALGRNGFEESEMRYNVAITIEAPGYKGSLYDAILQTYQYLSPIEIQNINRLMV